MRNSSVIHLIDDDEAVRRSLAFSLTTAGLAVRVYDSAVAFLDVIADLQPGCVVSDIRMPAIDGLELQRRLVARRVNLPMIFMTGHADVQLAVEAMKAGAVDFIEKPFDDEVLLAAIGAALNLHHGTAEREAQAGRARLALDGLSVRESEVLQGLLAGRPNKTIAFDMGISSRTVEVHRANLMIKTGAGSLSELVRMALLANRLLGG